jgi:prevent-host-death family protein
MMERWQLQDAKNRFSEVVEKAVQDGPQIVTRRGVETVVVISMEEYKRLTRPRTDLVEFFRRSPLAGIALDLERNKDLPREVDL